MTLYPWVEVAPALQERLGYVGGQEYEMSGGALEAIVEAGFDIQVRHVRGEAQPEAQVSPGGRGFGQR